MRLDTQVQFVSLGAPLSLVGGAGINIPSAQIIDFMGVGVGVAPPNIIGNVALFGADLGIGDMGGSPKMFCTVGTAFATANGATLNLAIQLAADLGAAGNYQPGAWQTVVETGALTAAQLAANTVFARFDWPPAFPTTLRPRFARLLGQLPAAANFTAGTISFAGLTYVRDDQANKLAASNYKVQ